MICKNIKRKKILETLKQNITIEGFDNWKILWEYLIPNNLKITNKLFKHFLKFSEKSNSLIEKDIQRTFDKYKLALNIDSVKRDSVKLL